MEYREHMRDGDGTVELKSLIAGPEELNGKGRLFSVIKLNPGCSIGYHIHDKDAELFYIVKGTAEYNDNGEIVTVSAGDVTICPTGTGHGIANRTEEPVELGTGEMLEDLLLGGRVLIVTEVGDLGPGKHLDSGGLSDSVRSQDTGDQPLLGNGQPVEAEAVLAVLVDHLFLQLVGETDDLDSIEVALVDAYSATLAKFL